MADIFNMLDTWNAGATVFTGIKLNVTDTASAAGSLLMDLQVGGASAFSVDKAARASFGSASFRLGGPDVAGATATITASATTDLITWTSHGLVTGSSVRFSNSGGALPGAIVAASAYYVVVNDANSFKIAISYDRAIAASPTTVDITSNGTGTTTAKAAQVLQSMFLQNFTGTDAVGAPLVINGSLGTGLGSGGDIVFNVGLAGTTGSTPNVRSSIMTLNAATRSVDIRSGAATDGDPAFRIFDTNGTQRAFISSGGVSTFGQVTAPFLYCNNDFRAATVSVGSTSFYDTLLTRDAANTLAQRNGVNAQAFNLYQSYTDASNYTRGKVSAASGIVTVAGESAGTGATDIDIALTPKGTGRVRYGTHAAIAAETVTGYIEIKDAGGTVRKIAVVS